jgi:hypothetical protein
MSQTVLSMMVFAPRRRRELWIYQVYLKRTKWSEIPKTAAMMTTMKSFLKPNLAEIFVLPLHSGEAWIIRRLLENLGFWFLPQHPMRANSLKGVHQWSKRRKNMDIAQSSIRLVDSVNSI